MKTEFKLERYFREPDGGYKLGPDFGSVYIVCRRKKKSGGFLPAKVVVTNGFHEAQLKEKDLERFAVNILKVLGSKKLKN